MTALTLITLLQYLILGPLEMGLQWILSTRGKESHWLWRLIYKFSEKEVALRPERYGWPWTVGTPSWVIPTAFSLMAIQFAFKCCMPALVQSRISIGRAMLMDRACPGGGWHAGSGVVYGVPLAPHADATAIALLALAGDRHAPVIHSSLEWLRWKAPTLESLYTLPWIALAFHAYDIESSNLFVRVQTLWDKYANCETETLALVSLALQAHLTGINPFALS